MSDDNKELIGRLARRLEEPPPLPPTEAIPSVSGKDWNVPIDTMQADCMTEREVIRGIVAQYKEAARRWVPAPMPSDW